MTHLAALVFTDATSALVSKRSLVPNFKILLQKEGLKPENIIDSGICSVCNSDIIHSYRIEKKNYNTETAIIELKVTIDR